MASKKTLEIQKPIPGTYRILLQGTMFKDYTYAKEFRFKKRMKKNTKGAFGK